MIESELAAVVDIFRSAYAFFQHKYSLIDKWIDQSVYDETALVDRPYRHFFQLLAQSQSSLVSRFEMCIRDSPYAVDLNPLVPASIPDPAAPIIL